MKKVIFHFIGCFAVFYAAAYFFQMGKGILAHLIYAIGLSAIATYSYHRQIRKKKE